MFIFKLWRGEYSLIKTYWFFTIFMYFIFSLPINFYSVLTPETQFLGRKFLITYLFLFGAYTIISCVGLWRAATNYTKNYLWRVLAKASGAINLNKSKELSNTKPSNPINPNSNNLVPQNQVYKLIGTAKNELGTSQFFIDVNNIVRIGNIVKVWEKTNYSLQQVSSSGLYKSERLLSEYDCSVGTKKTISLSQFEEIDFQGKIVWHQDNWKDFPPVPVNSDFINFICSK